MSETESQNITEVRYALSVCDSMRDNTNDVIRKIESLLPSYIESFTNLQAEYLRIARDFFGTCYIAEQELLNKLGVDKKVIEGFDKCLKVLTNSTIIEIDILNNLQRMFVDNAAVAMRSYDDCVKIMLCRYAKILEYTCAILPNRN